MRTKLTANFYLDEFLVSQTAARLGIDNTPTQEHLLNIQRLARTLQDIRAMLGHKVIIITSGYRSPELNKAIKGSDTSAHMDGLAADFVCNSFGTPLQICQAIAGSAIMFDQVINEFGRWVHLGLPRDGEPYRRQLLTAKRENGRTVYLRGLQEV